MGTSPGTALASLQFAKSAILEARDFSGVYGVLDGDAIARMARSHTSDVLDNESASGLTATDASDRYLDEARVSLATIATRSVEAARAMDLLAAVYLSRADARTLPSATALCLRRAALQGQPENASLASRLGMHLADIGLFDEARWALEHSLSLAHTPQAAETLVTVLRRTGQSDEAARVIATMQNHSEAERLAQAGLSPRVPEITELSPTEFAALSKPVMPFNRSSGTPASLAAAKTNLAGGNADLASAKTNLEGNGNAVASSPLWQGYSDKQTESQQESVDTEKPGAVRRFMNSFKRIW